MRISDGSTDSSTNTLSSLEAWLLVCEFVSWWKRLGGLVGLLGTCKTRNQLQSYCTHILECRPALKNHTYVFSPLAGQGKNFPSKYIKLLGLYFQHFNLNIVSVLLSFVYFLLMHNNSPEAWVKRRSQRQETVGTPGYSHLWYFIVWSWHWSKPSSILTL